MKKIIIAVAIVCATVVSEAAVISWGAINVKTPIATDVKVSQTGIIGSGAAMESLAIQLFWVSSTGDISLGSYSTGTGTSAGKVAAVTLGNGTSSDLYAAMVADQGTTWKPQYHFTATYKTADGTYTYDGYATSAKAIGDLSQYNVTATANFGSATTGSWSYEAASVPEPTSGLLLLLGMAGLALRRRRA